MTLTEYLRVIRQQWWLVLLLTALALGGAAAYTFTVTPTYTASTKLFISVSTNGRDVADLSSGSTFTQQRVKSYADIVTSAAVLDEVIGELHLPYTTTELAQEITADSPLDTVLLQVSVTDTAPTRAAGIANALATAFPRFVDALETPRNGTTSPVKVSVTQPADVPEAPVSPKVPLNLALGLLVGLGLGVGAAVLRDQLNTSITGVGEIEKLTGAIPLGVVPYDKTTARQPLIEPEDQGGRAEAFRTLRTNLQFTNVDHPPRVVVVSSPLPSDGKSTTCCNLALTLAISGARTVLVEGDLRKPSLGKYLGLSNAAGLTNVLAGQHDVRDVLVSYQGNLTVLPSGPHPPNPSELLGSTHMANLIESLSKHYDFVVIDAPPLLPVTDAAVLAALSDGAVLVARHGATTRENLDRAIQSLEAVNAKLLGTVLNFAPRRKRGNGYDGYGYGYGYGASVPRQWSRPSRAARKVEAPTLGRASILTPPQGTVPNAVGHQSLDVRAGQPEARSRR